MPAADQRRLDHAPKAEAMLNAPVSGTTEKPAVKLGALVQLKRSNEPAEITHVNLERVVDIWVNVEGRTAAVLARAVEERVKRVEFPKGIVVEVRAD